MNKIAMSLAVALLFTATPAMAEENAFETFFTEKVPAFFSPVGESVKTGAGRVAKYADNGYRVAREDLSARNLALSEAVERGVEKVRAWFDETFQPLFW